VMGCGASSPAQIFGLIEQGEVAKLRSEIRAKPTIASAAVNHLGDTALHWAAWKDPKEDASCLQAILDAPNIELNAVNRAGFTPLHLAMTYGREAAARALLRAGARIDIQEPAGQTPLHFAAERNYDSCIKAAIDCAVDPAKTVNVENKLKQTPLHTAALKGHADSVGVLVDGGAEIDSQTSDGRTALHEASEAGHINVVKLLLKKGANSQIETKDGKLPVNLANAAGHKQIAEELGDAPKEEDIVRGKVTIAGGGGCVADNDQEGLLPANDLIKDNVQELMDTTWRNVTTRDRAFQAVADKFEVVQVLQNSNKELWSAYCAMREIISCQYVEQLKDIKTATEKWDASMLEKRQMNVNEFFLFHGTRPSSAKDICNNGFRVDLSGSNKGSLYGPGIYCAESSAKADEYARDDKEGLYMGLYAMLLCRVVLGNPVVSAEDTPDVAELSRQLQSADKHSILGDREAVKNTFREFVVREASQAYPAYVIIYRRKM